MLYDRSLPMAASLLRGNHLAGRGRLARVGALLWMHAALSIQVGDGVNKLDGALNLDEGFFDGGANGRQLLYGA